MAIINTRATTQAYALYAQAEQHVAPSLTIKAGGRYSSDDKCASANNEIGTAGLDRTCKT